MQKPFLFMLLVLLFVSFAPLRAQAADGDIASGSNENGSWRITSAGKLIVETNGQYPTKSGWKPAWLSHKTKIKTATITLKNCDTLFQMFAGCKNLTSITWKSVDTSGVTDMSEMFDGCTSLTKLDLSGFDTSKVTDMYGMFSDCSSLKTLDVSSFNTAKVEQMQNMFGGCSSLKTLDISSFRTPKVTKMWGMFYGCEKLTTLDLSKFKFVEVTDMSDMFSGCSSLTGITFGTVNTSKVTNMVRLFRGCEALKELNIGNFDTPEVIHMDYMFQGCKSLTSLNLKSFDTSKVIHMDNMFDGCSSLTSLNVSKFNTSSVRSMDYMFAECSSLTNLDLSSFSTSQVSDMSYMFYKCTKLKTLDISYFDMSGLGSSFNSLKLETLSSAELIKMPAGARPEYLPYIAEGLCWYDAGNNRVGKTYENTTAPQTYTLGPVVTGVTLSPTSMRLTAAGATGQLTATVLPTNAKNKAVSYASSNTNVATVNAAGLVTAVGNGTATITVTAADDSYYTASCSVTVHIHQWAAGWTTNAGAHYHVCTAAGCDITSPAGMSGYAAHAYDNAEDPICNVCGYTRAIGVGGVTLSPASIRLTAAGATNQLTAAVSPATATNKAVTYISSAPAVATVNAAGLVTAVGNGTATITATTADGGRTASCSVTVHIHQWATGWTSNASAHYHVCTAAGCDITSPAGMSGYAAHVYDNAKDASCNVCAYTRTIAGGDTPAHTHSWSAVWTTTDSVHYHACTAAGCDVTDPAQQNSYGKHSYDDEKDDRCNVCGYTRTLDGKKPSEGGYDDQKTDGGKPSEGGSDDQKTNEKEPSGNASDNQTDSGTGSEKEPTGNELDARTDLPLLLAEGRQAKGNRLKLSWNKYKGASSYEVYWSYCDGKKNFKRLKSLKGTTYTHSRLNKKRSYKYFVVACKKAGGKKVYLAKSPNIHVAMDYHRSTNVRSIKLNKSKLSLQKGKDFQIKATVKKQKQNKKLINHVSKLRYYSSDKQVAKVSSKGKITAKKAGKCTIYAVASNGLAKTIEVTVK